MAILPIEKVCPRCHTRFAGRKNKVFCSETCKVDANNQKLMQAYHSLRGTKPIATDKANNAHYVNNSVEKNANYPNKENELLAQNWKLQEEIEHLKQALAAQAAPLQHTNASDQGKATSKREVTPERIAAAKEQAEKLLKENKLAGMKEKLAVAKVQMEKEEEEREQKAEKSAALKVKAGELKKKLLELDPKEEAKKNTSTKPVKKKK